MRTPEQKAKHREYNRGYRKRFPEKVRAAVRKSYHKYRAKRAIGATERACAWAKANRERANANKRRWAKRNRTKVLSARKKWNDRNRKTYIRSWMRDRRQFNPSHRILMNLRCRISQALKGTAKSKTTVGLLGCSIEDFWIYLETKFETGMTRENYGSVWHLDHIVPCALFDLTNPDHQKRCFHFSNHQPLFPKVNMKKSAKTDGQMRLI